MATITEKLAGAAREIDFLSTALQGTIVYFKDIESTVESLTNKTSELSKVTATYTAGVSQGFAGGSSGIPVTSQYKPPNYGEWAEQMLGEALDQSKQIDELIISGNTEAIKQNVELLKKNLEFIKANYEQLKSQGNSSQKTLDTYQSIIDASQKDLDKLTAALSKESDVAQKSADERLAIENNYQDKVKALASETAKAIAQAETERLAAIEAANASYQQSLKESSASTSKALSEANKAHAKTLADLQAQAKKTFAEIDQQANQSIESLMASGAPVSNAELQKIEADRQAALMKAALEKRQSEEDARKDFNERKQQIQAEAAAQQAAIEATRQKSLQAADEVYQKKKADEDKLLKDKLDALKKENDELKKAAEDAAKAKKQAETPQKPLTPTVYKTAPTVDTAASQQVLAVEKEKAAMLSAQAGSQKALNDELAKTLTLSNQVSAAFSRISSAQSSVTGLLAELEAAKRKAI